MIKFILDFLFRQIAVVAWKFRVISRKPAKHDVPTMPQFDILPFSGGGSMPVQYDLDYEGHSYYIRYRYGWVSVTRDFCFENETEVLEQQLSNNEYHGSWNDEETTVYLALISDSIRRADFEKLRLPTIEETASHPFYRNWSLAVLYW